MSKPFRTTNQHPDPSGERDCFDCRRSSSSLRELIDRYGSRLLLCPNCYTRRVQNQVAI